LNAQTKVEIINDVGAKGPCLGIGLGMALVPKCVSRAEKEGFIPENEVGTDGLTIGTTGAEDGVITAVTAGSAGAAAGVAVGDRVISVDSKPMQWTPAMEAARQTFGERDKQVTLTVKAAGGGAAQHDVTFAREQSPMPKGAPSGSMLVPLMPLMDWRGRFVPCTAAGPMTLATYAICEKHFQPWGYVKAKDVGSVGFAVDPARMDAAVVTTVTSGSAAEKAGLKVGDVIVAVDGKPLAGSTGELARTALFGRAVETRTVVVQRGAKQITETVVLGKKEG
jgi:C-terminal processing protease CtpA/Prc